MQAPTDTDQISSLTKDHKGHSKIKAAHLKQLPTDSEVLHVGVRGLSGLTVKSQGHYNNYELVLITDP